MGNVLDSILKKQVISGPEAVSADFVTEAIDIDNREMEYSLQALYENGIAVDMIWSLEASNNKTTWSEVSDSQQAFSDATGSILYDMAGSGFSFVRLKITVTAGSLDLTEVLYIAKRRH